MNAHKPFLLLLSWGAHFGVIGQFPVRMTLWVFGTPYCPFSHPGYSITFALPFLFSFFLSMHAGKALIDTHQKNCEGYWLPRFLIGD